MIHPIGVNLTGRVRFSGTVSGPTGTLYVNDVSSATNVTVSASADLVSYSVVTSALSVNDRVYVAITGTVASASTYKGRRRKNASQWSPWVTFKTGSSSTFAIPVLYGLQTQ